MLGGQPVLLNCAIGARNAARFPETVDWANMEPSEIAALIEAGLPDAVVRVRSPDNTHFEAIVVAEAFDGKRPLQRHQLVYECLGTLMGNEIHAMSIRAHTPAEWQQLEPAGQD